MNGTRRLLYSGIAVTALLALVAVSSHVQRDADVAGATLPSTKVVEGVPPPHPNFAPRPVRRNSAPKPKPQPAREGWLTVVILGGIALAVGVSVAAFARWRQENVEEDATLADALDDVLADTLEDLRAERDPRRAVIRAYARMEQTFAAYGLPRDQAEAPFEYLARVLESMNVSAFSVRRLTHLFERAKFSTHEINRGMKEDAIEALAGLRAELETERKAA